MAEIFNLSNLCRCCHADGQFKRLDVAYDFGSGSEIYANLIHDLFGLYMRVPPAEYSYNICDACIGELRAAARFKMQILDCERKFTEYCRNEQFISMNTENIKIEYDGDENADNTNDSKSQVQKDIDITLMDDNDNDNTNDSKFQVQKYIDTSLMDDNIDNDNGFDNDMPEYNNDDIKQENEKVKVEDAPETKKANDKKNNCKKSVKRKDNTDHKPNRIAKNKKGVGVTNMKRNSKGKRIYGVERIQKSLMLNIPSDNGCIHFCKGCRQKFNSEDNLKTHVTNTHTDTVFRCIDCDKTFKYIFDFVRHDYSHIKSFLNCVYCDKEFSTTDERKTHENDIHGINFKLYICDVCNKEFTYKAVLTKHLLLHNGIKKFICETCGLRFADAGNLNVHVMTVHKRIKRFKCDICDMKFLAKKVLRIHLLKHKGIKPFKCDLCPKSFNYKNGYLRHLEVHKHKNDDVKFKCPHCPKTFNSTQGGQRHVRKHRLPVIEHMCQVCNKTFLGKYSYNRHMYMAHTAGVDKTPFPCDLCQKRFSTKGTLHRHKAKCATNEIKKDKVSCELCKQKVFDIERHLRTHNIRPFACSYCPKTFPAQNSLNRHLKGHENDVTFDCNLCPKKYKLKEGLKRHKVKSHGVNSVEPKVENYDYGGSNWCNDVDTTVD